MRKTVFLKIFAGYAALCVLITGAAFFLTFTIARQQYEKTLTAGLEKQCGILLAQLEPLVEQRRLAELNSFLKKLGPSIDTRITVIDLRGVVLADSERDPASMENHLTRPEVLLALHGTTGSSQRYSTTVRENMLYVAVPVRKGQEIRGVLRASLFMHGIERMLGEFTRGILWVTCSMLVIGLAVSFLIARRLTRPIRTLSAASQRIAAGDFGARVFISNTDEFRELADSFNAMTEKIRDLFQEVSFQKEELTNILSSMNEALLALDADGRIVRSNEALRRLLPEQPIEGRFYWELIRAPELGEIIREVRAGKRRRIGEVTTDQSTFLCSASLLGSGQGILLVLLDISEMKSLERMKKDFVVNVSHELRTPLTAIKGFVETLLEQELPDPGARYLEIIQRHTNRLINITRDLMALARLEREEEPDLQQVNLRDLLDKVAVLYEQRFREKQLTFEVELQEGAGEVRADAVTLEQLFINLLDNAVKYTERGGITISASRRDGQAVIEVADTGIGIEAAHLPRIFERFYVTDKSRSRTLGGTGLGLSIVKHIVLLHGGSIDAASTPGQGTRFTIRLPQ